MGMRRLGLTCVLLGALAPVAWLVPACSGDTAVQAGPVDAGEDGGFGLTSRDGASDASSDASYRRMLPHEGNVLHAVQLRIVYIGEEGVDGAPNVDDFVAWLVKSSWWDILAQYGVHQGTLLPSVRVPSSAIFTPGLVVDGLVLSMALDQRLAAILHPGLVDAGSSTPADASTDADLDAADVDASDGGPLLPPAEAYLVMLPNGVNVNLGTQGSHTFQTCIDAGGYHGYDGFEPYAVMPPCRLGRSALAISHELSEMATNPVPGEGWFSEDDADQRAGGGEVADICNFPVSKGVDGWLVSQIWSNAVGACAP